MATELWQMDNPELLEVLKGYGVTPPVKAELFELRQLAEKAICTARLKAESSARAEMASEARKTLSPTDLKDVKNRPSPETWCIEHSRKVYATFINMENPAGDNGPGADIEFDKGAYHFHLFDGLKHVLPECLVADEPLANKDLLDVMTKYWQEGGLDPKSAVTTAQAVLNNINLPHRCTRKIYRPNATDDSGLPKNLSTGAVTPVSVPYRNEPRFMFKIHGPAPADAELGSIV